jgi:hypothetical protein
MKENEKVNPLKTVTAIKQLRQWARNETQSSVRAYNTGRLEYLPDQNEEKRRSRFVAVTAVTVNTRVLWDVSRVAG